ncbi:MAG: M48 family metallopeptidase [Bacilli bacterium]|nr:M48 family metallopeptidase [Bacilli bacterium]
MIFIEKTKMVFSYNNIDYDVVIVRKNNKNTYIRIKDNAVYITTNHFTTNRSLNILLKDNRKSIEKMIDKTIKKNEKDKNFYLFGKKYNIIINSNNSISISDNNIYIKDGKLLNKWLNNYIETTFSNHLKYWYELFEENIPTPNLKIRKMKTRWGVCNTKNYNITLNRELYKYDIECLDYVIVHELSHLLEANHSKKFWEIVEKYYPNYKKSRKMLRD